MHATTKPVILAVEDDRAEREALARLLRMEEYEVLTAADPQRALEYLDQPIYLVISDVRMGPSSGLDLLRYWEQQRPHTPFIMITAHSDVDDAVTAMKLGAKDYLTKPVDPDRLLSAVSRCLEERRPLHVELKAVWRGMIGRSSAMQQTFEQIRRAAETESTVLLVGESGTGKELAAQAIHDASPRREHPFVVVSMADVTKSLVESELFGHLRGAFTNATSDRVGRFGEAQGGTIFIDEIGDFPLESQGKLLRVLENRTIIPVGSNEEQPIEVRVVAATNRDLGQMVSAGEFREDLFYRINVVTIPLPPLRERREDIPLLCEHFLRELSRANHRSPPTLEPELLWALRNEEWPGNVRQLRNCLESMLALARGAELTLADLPANLQVAPHAPVTPLTVAAPQQASMAGPPTAPPLPPPAHLHITREAIVQALEQFGGNRTHAARALGISVRTLQRRLKAWRQEN